MEERLKLEIKVARILAAQYHSGVISKEDNLVNSLGLKEYFNKSLYNWINAARGVISLIKNSEKENFSDGGGI